MTTPDEARLKLQARRRSEFFDAALRYYAVSSAFSHHRPTDKPDPVADDLAAALEYAESELYRAGKMVLGASCKRRTLLVREAIRGAMEGATP